MSLPQGWCAATLDDVGEWSSGGTPHRANTAYYGGAIPWVKTGDLKHSLVGEVEEFLTEEGLQSSSAKLFPAGTLLVAMYGATIGQTGVLGMDAATNQACAALIAKGQTKDLIPFLWRYLISKQDDLRTLGQGGAQPNISQAILKTLALSVPPLPEQRRIVAKIDSLTGKSRRAREHLDHIPRLVEKYKQAVLAAAFSGELTREWRSLRARQFPWPRVRWSDAGTTLNGRAFPSSDYAASGTKLLRPGNLASDGTVRWGEANTKYLPPRYAEVHPRYLVRGSELIINLTAQSLDDQFLGRACLSSAADEFLLNQRLAVFRPTDMDRRFCLFALKSPRFRAFVDDGLNSGSLIQHIHTKQLYDYPFDIPLLDEQLVIVEMCDRAFALIDRLAAEATSARKLLDRLDQSILAKAFRGELVPQDPNDEPASVLLERIRAERAAAPKPKRGHKVPKE